MTVDNNTSFEIPEMDELISAQFLRPTLEGIVGVQEQRGAVPEMEGGVVEPWTHVECAMAIDAGSFHDEAGKAYEWLAGVQLPDGSWYASYQNGQPKDTYKVSHAISYIAVGVWHHYLITGDRHFLKEMWPSVENAINYILQSIYCF